MEILKKMGLMKDDPEEIEPAPVPLPKSIAPPVVFSQQPTMQFATSAPIVNLSADNQYIETLNSLLPTDNVYGIFVGALSDMAAIPVSEDQKFMMAFAALKRQGVTVQSLISAANEYKSITEAEKADFDSSYSSSYQTKVSDKQEAIVKDQQIIVEATERIHRLQAEVNESTLSLESEKVKFEMSFAQINSYVTSQVEKIEKYLNGTSK